MVLIGFCNGFGVVLVFFLRSNSGFKMVLAGFGWFCYGFGWFVAVVLQWF